MKALTGLGVGILVLTVVINMVYAAPKEAKDKDKGNGQKRAEEIKTIPVKTPSDNAASKAKHLLPPANRGKEPKKEFQRIHAVNKNKEQEEMRAYLPESQKSQRQKYYRTADHSIRRELVDKKNEKILKDLEEALRNLKHSRWSYNPHDERGQGNMGKVDMIAPYGHDKDSDRMELYGNRGRVIKAESTPEPVPEPIPEPEPEPEPAPEPIPEPEPQPQPEPEPEPQPQPEPTPPPEPPI